VVVDVIGAVVDAEQGVAPGTHDSPETFREMFGFVGCEIEVVHDRDL
jgi:hypothetical protein